MTRLLEAPDRLAERLRRSLLAHLAFNALLVSRDERAKAFLSRNQDFLDASCSEAAIPATLAGCTCAGDCR